MLVILAVGCAEQNSATELTVSAATSLTDALTEIRENYEVQHGDVRLHFNFGASGALQRQIEQGAPVDLFVFAAASPMRKLVEQGLVREDQQAKLLSNVLVVVVPKESGKTVASLTDLSNSEVKNIAVGVPESVPAGRYAKEALTKAGLWDSLQSALVQGKDVRQVLHYVETGNSDAGFVYRSDALASSKVKIAFAVDFGGHSPIEYPAGLVKTTKHPAEAREFYAYLQSADAAAVFEKYGFIASYADKDAP